MAASTPAPIREIIFQFPPIFALDKRNKGNTIQQLVEPGYSSEVVAEPYAEHRIKGYVITPREEGAERILAISNTAQSPEGFDKVLRLRSGGLMKEDVAPVGSPQGKWIKHPGLSRIPNRPIDYNGRIRDVLDSWHRAFTYVEEDRAKHIGGLRLPQIGAVHAVHAHWAVNSEAATIVMPTGTGKTETMLSILVSSQCQRLLVVVPSDALRAQIAGKFLTLGILREIGVVSRDASYPIVGILKHKPKDSSSVDALFEKCNIIVTTMSIAGQCPDVVQDRMAHHCPFLFIDEAHHIAATTWEEFKRRFESRRILQFTATPFRNDDKPVGGKIVFNYPLRKAQEDGYFTPIHFKPIIQFDPKKADQAIAEKAVEQLREDRKEHNHILMARAADVKRARQIFSLYERYTEFNPVQLHTGIKSAREREQIRRKLLDSQSSIVVCVDMIGEGFDLPELKIAAFHDIRKSLPVTLQLAGRFTRSKPDLGEATFIANIADVTVGEEIRKLYSQDADWNTLLREMSQEVIEEKVSLWEFIEGFTGFPEEIPLQNMRPAMSTVAYRTKCKNWAPQNFKEGIQGIESLERIHHDINPGKKTLVIVTARKAPISWAQIKEIFNWDWELYVLFWDRAQNLLFIHGSSNRGYYKKLAEAVAGEVELVRGPRVFRCFSGINRLRLQNVGLIQQLGRLIRYTMRAGSDVEPGLSEAQRRNVVKSNIFGVGYENGSKTTVGCSYKGRIWSRRITNLEALTRWCSFIGSKVLDDTIDPDKVLKGTLVPTTVSERPKKMPISIEWPEVIYRKAETAYSFAIGKDIHLPLYNTEITLLDPTESAELRFGIRCDTTSAEFALSIFQKRGVHDYRFSAVGGSEVLIANGVSAIALEEFFYDNPPTIWFADGSSLEGNSLTELKTKYEPYPSEKILLWDWTGTNIRKESQGIAKNPDSIQYKVIQELRKGGYDIVFDDDGSGEAADVVGIRVNEKSIAVEFYHCKFSMEDKPGRRIGDLYAVCGQAQKSIHWVEKPSDLFLHLLRREPKREKGQEVSRFEQGNRHDLFTIKEKSRALPVKLSVFIVQPGLSKGEVSRDQQELLSVTENYLMETYKLHFGVIASP